MSRSIACAWRREVQLFDNFQYFTPVVDPRRRGSGDKLVHDVVAGGLGVFEGDGGDLRVGLSIQSVHDGSAWTLHRGG